jgi:predicted DNA binding CopG/RHH family protein
MLKATREKHQVTYKQKLTRITARLLSERLKTMRSWNDVLQPLKNSNCQPRLIYSAKLFLVIEGEIKAFHNKQKLKEFTTTEPTLQKIHKRVLHRKRKISLTMKVRKK